MSTTPDECVNCPTCRAVASVEASLKDAEFPDAMVALIRVMAKKLVTQLRPVGNNIVLLAAVGEAEKHMLRQLRDHVAFELSQPVQH